MALPFQLISPPHFHPRLFSNPNPNIRFSPRPLPSLHQTLDFASSTAVCCASDGSDSILQPSKGSETPGWQSALLLPLVASAVFLIGSRARASAFGSSPIISSSAIATISENEVAESSDLDAGKQEDEEFRAAFERWKSKVYALTVPLRIVSLRGSIPPSWIKDFMQVEGRRLKLNSELRGSLESIFSELSSASNKGHLDPKSAMAADLVSVGDSWLSSAISRGLIEPIHHAEEQDWFKGLSDKWKVYLRRNNKGELDSNGCIWGAPYRWGTMVIAYKTNKFSKHKLTPIQDWSDLWRPELAGKISMVDSPREAIGATLKHMEASYNTKDIDSELVGGRTTVMHNLALLQGQVRLFDSVHYLKAFGAGDVWVAVGWSSDVIPAAKRMSNVAVIVPKSGTSLWADLWAIPAATRFTSDRIGGRIRGPSPVIHQWIEFCLQTARGLAFQQQVIPGASPCALECLPVEGSQESTKRKPKLETNLIDGVPPHEILSRCEFLEPLSEKALEDHQWLISNMQKPCRSWMRNLLYHVSLLFHSNRLSQQSS